MTAEITPESLRLAASAADDYEAIGKQIRGRFKYEGLTEVDRRVAAIRSLIAHATETCEWMEDEDGDWKSDCGYWYLHSKMDGLANNHIKFCPYCGKSIKETRFALTETPRPGTPGEMMGEK